MRAFTISGTGAVCGTTVSTASNASSCQDTGSGPIVHRQNPWCTGTGDLRIILTVSLAGANAMGYPL